MRIRWRKGEERAERVRRGLKEGEKRVRIRVRRGRREGERRWASVRWCEQASEVGNFGAPGCLCS